MGRVGWDEDTLKEVARIEHDDLSASPSSPVAGQLSHYAKSGRFHQKTSAGVEKVVGPQVASEVDLATAITDNAVLGASVQDFINRIYGPTNSEKATYLGNQELDYVEIFNSPSQVTENRRAKIQLAYSSDNVSSEVVSLYDTNGTTVLKTITLTHSYTGTDYNTTTTVIS